MQNHGSAAFYRNEKAGSLVEIHRFENGENNHFLSIL